MRVRPPFRTAEAVLSLLLVALISAASLSGPAAFAQDAPAPAEEAAPELPAAVTDPGVDPGTLTLRLIPLTHDDLAAAADEWQGIVKAGTEKVVALQIALAGADGDAEAPIRENLAAATETRNALLDKYSEVITAWANKGADPAAIERYRKYSASIRVEQTRTSDWKTLLTQGWNWMLNPEGGLKWLINGGIIIGAFIALFILAGISRRLARRGAARVPNLSKLLQGFLAMLAFWLTIAIGLLVVLSALGINITPIFALIGGASFILAFALQDTLGNLAAGIMIMLNRPFDEGDYVDIGGVAGTVKSVSIVSTTVTTPDNQTIVVPNSKVWGNVITNVTASPTRRVDLTFGISYDDPIQKVQEVLERVTLSHPLVLRDPEPTIRVNELADSSVNFVCRPWVNGADYWTVYWDLTRQVKEAFDAEGISIPFPQSDLHIRHDSNASAAAAAGLLPAAATTTGPRPDQAAGDEGRDDERG